MNIENIKKALGPSPEKCPTNGKVVESVTFKNYIREKIAYHVESDEVVFAYLLKPIREGIYPTIICHHQHHSDRVYGKEEPTGINGNENLFYGEELVKLGYITFMPDSLAYGERRGKEDPIGYNYWQMATRLVQGKTLLAKNIHDIMQGIDYLETRQDVDQERIGFIGHSFGGRMGIWSAAFDKRIKATVCNCGCISYKESLSRDAGIQLEFVIQGILQKMDIEDVVSHIAPNHLLISGTSDDKWSRGIEQIYHKAKPHFHKGNLELLKYEGGHVFTKKMRRNAYDYLNRFLKN